MPPSTDSRPKRPIWVRASGRRITRIKKARTYLRMHARIPVNEDERHAALFVVACNLRLYHQLPIDWALNLIREHFNPRCVDEHGKPHPFTDDEIREEYRRAGLPGMYPTLGVNDPKAIRKAARKELRKDIRRFCRWRLLPGGSCHPAQVLAAFIEFRGGDPISNVDFGREFAAITGIRRVTPFGVPTYRGIHLKEPARRSRKAA